MTLRRQTVGETRVRYNVTLLEHHSYVRIHHLPLRLALLNQA